MTDLRWPFALLLDVLLDRPEDGYGLNETVWPEGATMFPEPGLTTPRHLRWRGLLSLVTVDRRRSNVPFTSSNAK